MWLSLLILVLLFAVAIIQAKQGWFSALIMALLSICCATAALGTYEWVAIHWLAPYWKPDYSYAVALAVLFSVPLIVLRTITDKLVRRSCLLPLMFDRIGAGVCGLTTGYIIAGVLALAIQMVPFGGPILGYRRVPLSSDQGAGTASAAGTKPPAERDLLLKPDRFVVGVASLLSAGIFSGEQVFGYATPDEVQAIGWAGAVPAEVSRFAPPRSVSVKRTAIVPFVYQKTDANERAGIEESFDPKPPPAGHEFLMVAVGISSDARDERRSIVFSPRQFRVAGRIDGKGAYYQFHADAIQMGDPTQPVTRFVRTIVHNREHRRVVDDIFTPHDARRDEVEVVFEVPERFVPEYVEYKHGGVAAVPGQSEHSARRSEPTSAAEERRPGAVAATTKPATSGDAESTDESSGRRRRPKPSAEETSEHRGGNVRGVTTREGQSVFGDALPVPMKSYQRYKNAEIHGGKLVSGGLVGEFDKQAGGADPEVTKFDVPSDKRLLQLNVSKLHTRSMLGGAIDFAASTVQNYFVEDTNGNLYKVLGKCAIAKVNGVRYVEVQYFKEPSGTIGGLGKFEKIKNDDLKGDYEFLLLFQVEPGAEIVSFQTGGSATRGDDLRGENIIAPK